MFIGRQTELNLLEEHYRSDRSEFCVLYGRRRIGKSTLLEKFTENKSAFFFLAGRETKRQQLKRFIRELGEAASDPLTGKTVVSEWDEALMMLDRTLPLLSRKPDTKKAIVIYDEFQWMCRGAVELLSDLQRHWDKKWKDAGNLMLILCGSSISFMLGDVLSRKSPLFGRRTFSFELNPFKVKEAAALLRFKGKYEVAESYLAVGGVPKYLEIMNTKGSFRQSITKEAFTSSGYFFEEIRFLLAEQLRETEHYYMVLSQLAKGGMGVTELEKSTGIGSGQIMYYLERLNLLGFVFRHIPIGKSINTKKVQYRLDDYYLRFYFTFIHPAVNQISINPTGIRFDSLTKNRWDVFSGISFEHFVRDHAATIVSRAGFEGGIKRMGRFWQTATKRKRGVQIDLLIECDDRITLICECKWSREKTGMDAVHNLRKRMDLYPNALNHTLKPVIVASGGVTKNVLNEKDISVISLDDFFM